jgi:hypothetical protein
MARKKKTKIDEVKEKQVEYEVTPVKWEAGQERKEQGYWTGKYKPEYDDIASRLIAVGFTEKNLANTFGITSSALKGWKRSFPSFNNACRGGKLGQLRKLAANSMLEAVGYDYKTTKTKTTYDRNGNVDGTEIQTIDNHQAGNATLAMFIMCNLSNQLQLGDEDGWKSKQKVEVENKNLSINITAELVGEQIDRLAGKLLSSNNIKQIEAEIIEPKVVEKEIRNE